MLGTKYLHDCTKFSVFFEHAISSGKSYVQFESHFLWNTIHKFFKKFLQIFTIYVILEIPFNLSALVSRTIKWSDTNFAELF